jgi:hypothetical protein
VPLLAICRGLQELNVALGGTLHQHVHELPGRFDHRSDKTRTYPERYGLAHPVTVTPGGRLQATLGGAGRIEVNSLHGQGIDRLAPDLVVEAVADDGTIEAVSVEGSRASRWRSSGTRSGGCSRTRSRGGCSRPSATPPGRRRPPAAERTGVMDGFQQWLRDHHVTEVECIVADINGIARGKILPGDKFLRSIEDESLRLPESIFIQTYTGEYPEEDVTDPVDRDVILHPDPNSIRLVPWYAEPTAQVIADCTYHDGKPVEISSRGVLRRVLKLYESAAGGRWWRPSSSSS